ncbi:MAG: hypothetical protein Fues2KO_28860 [Fuerstiella sp.]
MEPSSGQAGQSNDRSEQNPFAAPKTQSVVEPRLGDDDEFLVAPSAILCRETVHLPQVCIHLGLDDDVQPRRKKLRVLPLWGGIKLIAGAVLLLLMPLMLSTAGLPFFQGTITRIALFVMFPAGFMWLVWSLARNDVCKVEVTWYVSERYIRRMKLYRLVALLVLPGLAIYAIVEGAAESIGGKSFLIAMAVVVGLLFNPEHNLQLVGRRYNGFLLRGHSKRFFEALTQSTTDRWVAARPSQAPDDRFADTE